MIGLSRAVVAIRSTASWTSARRSKVVVVEGELARLDAREVEHVVDQRQERGRRLVGGLGKTALAGIERRVEQQLGGAEDAVHRRADLVADGRQELRLGDVGLLGAPARLLEVARLRSRARAVFCSRLSTSSRAVCIAWRTRLRSRSETSPVNAR